MRCADAIGSPEKGRFALCGLPVILRVFQMIVSELVNLHDVHSLCIRQTAQVI